MKANTWTALMLAVMAAILVMVGGQRAEARPVSETTNGPNAFICAGIPQVECEALTALYESTNGPSWSNNTGWEDDSSTPCSCHGVTCSEGHVTQLNLYNNQLSGAIPIELGNLANLLSLDLRVNQLNGAIPSTLGNLIKLQNLSWAPTNWMGRSQPHWATWPTC